MHIASHLVEQSRWNDIGSDMCEPSFCFLPNSTPRSPPQQCLMSGIEVIVCRRHTCHTSPPHLSQLKAGLGVWIHICETKHVWKYEHVRAWAGMKLICTFHLKGNIDINREQVCGICWCEKNRWLNFHYLVILLLFQICMIAFLLWNTKGVLKNDTLFKCKWGQRLLQNDKKES